MPFLFLLVLLLAPSVAFGQNAQVVSPCGTPNSTYGPGESKPLTQDTTGRECGSVTATPGSLTAVAASTALESNHVLSASAKTFFGAQINTTSAAEFVMAFDATSLPSNGAVTPKLVWQVAANSTLSVGENPGIPFTTGIVLGCSTTGPFTLTASALCMFAAGQVQ